MVTVKVGVGKLGPVPKVVPPVAPAYQLIVPAEAVAPNVTMPAPHLEPGVVSVRVEAPELTVTVIWFDVAEEPEAYVTPVLLDVKTQVTTSLFAKAVVV